MNVPPKREHPLLRFYSGINLKTKFIITNLFVVLIPISIIGTLFYTYAFNVIENDATKYKFNIVQLMGQRVDGYIFQLKQLSYSFYQPEVQKMLLSPPDQLVERFNYNEKLFSYLYASMNFTGLEGSFDSAVFIPPNGEFYQTGVYVMKQTYPFLDIPWYKISSDSKGEIQIYTNNSRPYLVVPPNELSISIIRSINSINSGGKLGVLWIDISVSQIAKLFNKFELKPEDNIYLIDQSGNIIFNSKDKMLVGKTLESDYYDWIGGDFSGKKIIDIDNDRVLITYYSNSNANWKIISIDRMADLKATLHSLRNRGIYLAVIALVIGIFLALFFTSHITNAISFLQMRMRKFQQGDFSTRIQWVRKDEIGKLGDSFNEMATHINDLIKHNYLIEIKEREAQFKALQAQINPHFLYNTLDSISSISIVQNAPLASEIASKLASMLRYSISGSGSIVTLKEELDHIQSYLAIQNIRYTDKFQVILNIHSEALDLPIIKLTLQPIVENAIYHGLEMKMGQGTIRITTALEEKRYVIEIADDGLGIPSARLEQLLGEMNMPLNTAPITNHNSSRGIGLVNVHERIRMQFGRDYGLSLNSTEEGTMIRIILPRGNESRE